MTIRRVRTPEGARFYGVPIGTPITASLKRAVEKLKGHAPEGALDAPNAPDASVPDGPEAFSRDWNVGVLRQALLATKGNPPSPELAQQIQTGEHHAREKLAESGGKDMYWADQALRFHKARSMLDLPALDAPDGEPSDALMDARKALAAVDGDPLENAQEALAQVDAPLSAEEVRARLNESASRLTDDPSVAEPGFEGTLWRGIRVNPDDLPEDLRSEFMATIEPASVEDYERNAAASRKILDWLASDKAVTEGTAGKAHSAGIVGLGQHWSTDPTNQYGASTGLHGDWYFQVQAQYKAEHLNRDPSMLERQYVSEDEITLDGDAPVLVTGMTIINGGRDQNLLWDPVQLETEQVEKDLPDNAFTVNEISDLAKMAVWSDRHPDETDIARAVDTVYRLYGSDSENRDAAKKLMRDLLPKAREKGIEVSDPLESAQGALNPDRPDLPEVFQRPRSHSSYFVRDPDALVGVRELYIDENGEMDLQPGRFGHQHTRALNPADQQELWDKVKDDIVSVQQHGFPAQLGGANLIHPDAEPFGGTPLPGTYSYVGADGKKHKLVVDATHGAQRDGKYFDLSSMVAELEVAKASGNMKTYRSPEGKLQRYTSAKQMAQSKNPKKRKEGLRRQLDETRTLFDNLSGSGSGGDPNEASDVRLDATFEVGKSVALQVSDTQDQLLGADIDKQAKKARKAYEDKKALGVDDQALRQRANILAKWASMREWDTEREDPEMLQMRINSLKQQEEAVKKAYDKSWDDLEAKLRETLGDRWADGLFDDSALKTDELKELRQESRQLNDSWLITRKELREAEDRQKHHGLSKPMWEELWADSTRLALIDIHGGTGGKLTYRHGSFDDTRHFGEGLGTDLDTIKEFAPESHTEAKQLAQSMDLAASLYPSSWIEALQEKHGEIRLGSFHRGFNRGGDEIALSGRGDDQSATAVHELGHSFELLFPEITELEWAFLRRRAGDEEPSIFRKSTDEWGNEYGVKDDLGERYSGRIYARESSLGDVTYSYQASDQYEVFTTGVEQLLSLSGTSSGDYLKDYEDKDYLHFLLGTLSLMQGERAGKSRSLLNSSLGWESDAPQQPAAPTTMGGHRYVLPDAGLEKVELGVPSQLRTESLTDGTEIPVDPRSVLAPDSLSHRTITHYMEPAGSYKEVNERLRGLAGDPVEIGSPEDPVFVLDQWLDSSALPEDVKVYRGVDTGTFGEGLQVGDRFQDHGYSSTSLERSMAQEFMPGAGGDLLEIDVPAGTKGLNLINGLDSFMEYEILLDRGLTFEVAEIIDQGDGIRVIRVRVVGRDGV